MNENLAHDGFLNMPMGTKNAEAIRKDCIGFYIAFCEKLAVLLRSSTEIL